MILYQQLWYLWVADTVQENLIAAAAAGECAAEFDVAFVTDFANYANKAAGSGNVTDDVYGACDGTAPPASGLSLTVSADATEVKLFGPWWNWDPAGGPIATDNGDGTFTVTLDSVPTSFDIYGLLTVEENLIAAAAAGECAAEFDAGAFVAALLIMQMKTFSWIR